MSFQGCSQLTGIQSLNPQVAPKQMLARQVLVTLPDSLKPKWQAIKAELAKKHALTETGEFPLESIGVDCLVYRMPDKQPIDATIKLLKLDSRVTLVQENQVFEGLQSGESDSFATISYAPKLMHADDAHRFTTGKGVKIAIIDTGAEKDHPDLKGRLSQTTNFVDGGDLSFTRDKHGTAVAGVLTARANDGEGIYGIAPEADVSLLKACWYPGQGDAKAQCSSWSLAKALDAAINSGARIINLSLAGPNDTLMAKLLEAANRRGVNIVAAASEQQPEPGFPANLPSVIPVVSSGPDNKIAEVTWLSRFPNTVAAPGVEILTTVPQDGYDFVSGSSLAAAHVSGIIALLLELDSKLSPQAMQHLLRQNGAAALSVSVPVLDICAIVKSLRNGEGC